MKSIVIIIMMIFSVFGCKEIEYSKIKTEKAEVIQLVYLPDTRRSDMVPGLSMSGNITFSVVDSGRPEYYGVIFRCFDHNKKFTLEGEQIFNAVKQGQIVTLEYVEIYEVDRSGKKTFVDYKTKNIIAN